MPQLVRSKFGDASPAPKKSGSDDFSFASEPLPPGPNWFGVSVSGSTADVVISGEIGLIGQTADDLINRIADCGEIKITIADCVGGCSLAAMKIFAALDGAEVDVDILGRCYSAAVIIALRGRKIRIAESGRIGIHTPRAWIFGDAAELSTTAAQIRSCQSCIHSLLAARLHPDLADCAFGWLTDGLDHFFSATEAKATGLIDEIFSPPILAVPVATPATNPPPATTEDERLFNDFLRAFGTVHVHDREKFRSNLNAWATHNILAV